MCPVINLPSKVHELNVIRSDPKKHMAKALIARANAARDQRAYVAAASLYEAAIEFRPTQPGLHMQAGHMQKEARNFDAAQAHYTRVLELTPQDPEIHLQLGHFNKTCGRLDDARQWYEQALRLRPDWEIPAQELKSLNEETAGRRWEQGASSTMALTHLSAYDVPPVFINPDLYPKPYEDLLVELHDAIVITRVGNYQRTRWGAGNTVRQIDALRGYFISSTPCFYVDIFIDGRLVKREPLTPGRERREKTGVETNKYSFNAWVDFSKFELGWHEVVFKGVGVKDQTIEGLNWRRERIIIAEPLPADVFAESDGWVSPFSEGSQKTLDEQINALPSVIHRASSRSIPVNPRTILVQRLDQLGDLAVSSSALKRLREIVPEARIVGLLGPANADLARTMDLFDEVLVFDFPDDPVQEDRILDRDGQLELARMLAPYKFDVAFDLACYGTTRQLLPLSGAPMMIGFGPEDWLTLSVALRYNEGRSRREFLRHAGAVRILIEAFAALIDSGARVIKREDLDPSVLIRYGINPSDKFVVLHAGSRIKFTRWPYFAELAERLIAETQVKVVVMAEDRALETQLAVRHQASDRLIFVSGKIPFDEFDAFASFAASFVGNDSGPKHLAALRGTNSISLHSARQNWTEWGQSPTGVVISRNVPCAGCALHHNPEECAKGVICITGITVDEVLQEMLDQIDQAERQLSH